MDKEKQMDTVRTGEQLPLAEVEQTQLDIRRGGRRYLPYVFTEQGIDLYTETSTPIKNGR